MIRKIECSYCYAPLLIEVDEDGCEMSIKRVEQQRIAELEALVKAVANRQPTRGLCAGGTCEGCDQIRQARQLLRLDEETGKPTGA